jgi:hypothetical protein
MKGTVALLCFLMAFMNAQHNNHAQLMGLRATGDKCGTTTSSSTVSATLSTSNGVEYKAITANGCPGYDWTSQSTPNTALQYISSVKIRTTPIINTTPTYIGIVSATGASLKGIGGALGIAINGVAIFGNADADNRDAYVYESMTFDTCRGHPQQQGVYHYHAEPAKGCVYTDTAGQHSPLFGYMFDSIPIFGVYGDNGTVPKDLDICNGHVDKAYPFYHYHISANLTYPYLVNCFMGCVTSSNSNNLDKVAATCTAASTQYDYSSLRYAMITNNSTSNAGASVKSNLPLMVIVLMISLFLAML